MVSSILFLFLKNLYLVIWFQIFLYNDVQTDQFDAQMKP